MRMELTILEFFEWKIGLPTPAHFMDYLLIHSVSTTDTHEDKPITDSDRVRDFVKKHLNYFLEITLQG